MRITGGDFGGRKYDPPMKNWPTRPTTDFSREAIFNILYNRFNFEDCSFLDLFGGTGSNSYEFISRSGSEATLVEKFGKALNFVNEMRKMLSIEQQLQVVRMDVFKFLKHTDLSFDIIFADPPYDSRQIPDLPKLIFEHSILKEDGILIIEHDAHSKMENLPHFAEQRKYGSTLFSFYKH